MTKDDNILADQIKLLAGEDVEPTPELIEAEYRSLAMPMAVSAQQCMASALELLNTSERLFKKVLVIQKLSGKEPHIEVVRGLSMVRGFKHVAKEQLEEIQKGG